MSYFVPAMVCDTCHHIKPLESADIPEDGEPCVMWLPLLILMKCPGTQSLLMVLAC